MGKFSTKNVEIKSGESQFITYGIQNLMITGMEVKISNTGSKQIVFNVESETIGGNFKPHDTAINGGKIGTIRTSYVKENSSQEEELKEQLTLIADKLEVRSELDEKSENCETLEDFVSVFLQLVKSKIARFKIVTEQSYNQEGKLRNSLKLARRYCVEKLSEPQKMTFDSKNEYDVNTKNLVKPDNSNNNTNTKKATDDLPF